MLAKYFSKQILTWKIPFGIRFIVWVMAIKRNLLQKKFWVFSYYHNLEWIHAFDIDKNAFNPDKRKVWISFFARLRNGQDFLQNAIESHIDFCDEIILVDNNSTDNTKSICLAMQKKYPNKVKFYCYTPEVHGVWNAKWQTTPDNSVHALSYYYNRTMSKTSYTYVAKLDDDMLIFDKKLLSDLIKKIRSQWLNYLQILPQINLNRIDGTIVTPLVSPSSNILPPIAWLYLDHGIFPISPKTYFVNASICEVLLFPFWTRISSPCFFHLKWLRDGKWVHNIQWTMALHIKHTIDFAQYTPLSKYLLDKFNQLWL